MLQGVQAAAGCAFAQTPGGSHNAPGGSPLNGKLGANYEAMSSFAKSAAKLSGKQLRTFGEAGFKYLAAHYDTWRGGLPPGSNGAASSGMPMPVAVGRSSCPGCLQLFLKKLQYFLQLPMALLDKHACSLVSSGIVVSHYGRHACQGFICSQSRTRLRFLIQMVLAPPYQSDLAQPLTL